MCSKTEKKCEPKGKSNQAALINYKKKLAHVMRCRYDKNEMCKIWNFILSEGNTSFIDQCILLFINWTCVSRNFNKRHNIPMENPLIKTVQ